MDGTFLSSKFVPILLVIIDNGLIETPFQFFQSHPTSLCRCFRVMNSMTGVGHASFKSLGHPPKKRFDGAFRRRCIRRCLFGNDAKPIHQHLPGAFRGENLPSDLWNHFCEFGSSVSVLRRGDDFRGWYCPSRCRRCSRGSYRVGGGGSLPDGTFDSTSASVLRSA